LTVCVMVISESVPRLKFISVLLHRSPVMDERRALYHRMIAHDLEGARQVVRRFLKQHSRAELFDQLLLPMLVICRRDENQRKLTTEDSIFLRGFVRDVIQNPEPYGKSPLVPDEEATTGCVVGLPATDEADELALLMLQEILREQRREMRVVSSEGLAALFETDAQPPNVFCIGFLPGKSFRNARRLSRELRGRFPELPILLGRWCGRDRQKTQRHFARLNVEFGWTLVETTRQALKHLEAPDHPRPSPPALANGHPVSRQKIEVTFLEQHS